MSLLVQKQTLKFECLRFGKILTSSSNEIDNYYYVQNTERWLYGNIDIKISGGRDTSLEDASET
jgi:hypothetical protein